MKKIVLLMATLLLALSLPTIALAHGGDGDRGHGKGGKIGPSTGVVTQDRDRDRVAPRMDNRKNPCRIDNRGRRQAVDTFQVAGVTVTLRQKCVNKMIVNKLQGRIVAVDVGDRIVTVRLKKVGTIVKVEVVAGAKIERDDVRVSLSAFRVGDEVDALTSRRTLRAFKIEAEDED